jgi:hypothetical protein
MSNRTSSIINQTLNDFDFYKVPQLYELEHFEIHGSSEEAIVEKWNELWEEIQEVKSYKTVLEAKLMNLTETDKQFEKVLIFFWRGSINQRSSDWVYQVSMLQGIKSQIPGFDEDIDEIEHSISVLINNTSYPAVYYRNLKFTKECEDIPLPRVGKTLTLSTSHSNKVRCIQVTKL